MPAVLTPTVSTNPVNQVPVTNYGPVGTADDSATVQACLNAADANATIIFPVGTTILKNVQIPANSSFTFRGGGRGSSIVKHHGAATQSMFTVAGGGTASVYVEDNLTFDGNQAVLVPTLYTANSGGWSLSIFDMQFDWGFFNCEFKNTIKAAVHIKQVNFGVVFDSRTYMHDAALHGPLNGQDSQFILIGKIAAADSVVIVMDGARFEQPDAPTDGMPFSLTDVITNTSTTITSATASWTSAHKNLRVILAGAGAAGADLDTWITSVTNGTTVVLHDAAAATLSNVKLRSNPYKILSDAAISSTVNPKTLTSASAVFTSADLRKVICVPGAGAAGGILTALITSINSGTSIGLSTAAGTTVSGASAYYSNAGNSVGGISHNASAPVTTLTDAGMTAESATLTSASAAFTSADVGKVVYVPGAWTGGAQLTATISAWVSGTEVTLSTKAQVTVSNAIVTYYGEPYAQRVVIGAAIFKNIGQNVLANATSPIHLYRAGDESIIRNPILINCYHEAISVQNGNSVVIDHPICDGQGILDVFPPAALNTICAGAGAAINVAERGSPDRALARITINAPEVLHWVDCKAVNLNGKGRTWNAGLTTFEPGFEITDVSIPNGMYVDCLGGVYADVVIGHLDVHGSRWRNIGTQGPLGSSGSSVFAGISVRMTDGGLFWTSGNTVPPAHRLTVNVTDCEFDTFGSRFLALDTGLTDNAHPANIHLRLAGSTFTGGISGGVMARNLQTVEIDGPNDFLDGTVILDLKYNNLVRAVHNNATTGAGATITSTSNLTVVQSDNQGDPWGGLAATGNNYVTGYLTSDQALSTGAYVDLVSVSLPGGTWLVQGMAAYDRPGGGATDVTTALYKTNSGSAANCFAERQSYSTGASSNNGVLLVGVVVLTTTTTVVLSAHSAEASINAKADSALNSNSQHKTTGIVALLIG